MHAELMRDKLASDRGIELYRSSRVYTKWRPTKRFYREIMRSVFWEEHSGSKEVAHWILLELFSQQMMKACFQAVAPGGKERPG